MKRIVFGMMILLLANALVLALGIRLAQSEPSDIIVPDDYATIQKAINAANPGDTIYVRASIYYEHVVVNRTVSLMGENRLTTVIDGGGVGDVVRIEAEDVRFSGFMVRSGFSAGICLYGADRCVIDDSIVTSNLGFGVVFYFSTYNIIENSEVSNNSWNGIDVGDTGSHQNTIRNNVIFQNGGNYGVDAYAGSDYTIIEDNTVHNNAWIGIAIGWSHNCVIRNNRLYNNTASSVVLDTASHCTVVNNTISNSRHGGITLLGLGNYFNNILNNTVRFGEAGIDLGASARYTTISGNIISRNNYGLRIAYNEGYPNYDNYVYHNDFVDNTVNARNSEDRYTSFWDDGYPSGGNYWSDYIEQDENRDGIGDIPYVIAGAAGSKDRYPLMGPFKRFATSLGETISVISNSTIEDFTYFASNGTIKMRVSEMTPTQTHGFCRICIPKSLSPPPYKVIIDEGKTPVLFFNYTLYDNGTHRWIYFAYSHSTHVIFVIPEPPTILALLIMVAAAAGVATFRKRKPYNAIQHVEP